MSTRIAARKPSLMTFNVIHIGSRQFSNSDGLQLVSDISTLTHASRRIGPDQSCSSKGFQVSVQARSTDLQHMLQLPDCGGTQYGQLTQNVRLRPTAHETYCSLNIGGQIGADESRHGSILPDYAPNCRLIVGLTLLVNNRVDLWLMEIRRQRWLRINESATDWPSRQPCSSLSARRVPSDGLDVGVHESTEKPMGEGTGFEEQLPFGTQRPSDPSRPNCRRHGSVMKR